MRYFWTIFWAIVISSLISYVLTSMAGEALTLLPIFVLAVIFSAAVIIIGDGILREDTE
ncbi:DUF2929 family protein [Aquibacillus halophilus]|uniref:DUF2929 family protein n=1 Tax=Aquibacillus halophilus TaxID=930132 RepID=A0A6A8DCT6_9BACI|nr:DUF2929 family protein [Aquibacillus halophilus]